MLLTKAPTDDPAVASPRGTAAVHPIVYIALLAFSLGAAFIYELRVNGIFGCPATAYAEDTYLAYCNTVGYGDYDHGAFWFDHEPQTQHAVASAQVLFLGSSRMAFGFSSAATDSWFEQEALSYYLLGFSHSENTRFVGPLMVHIAPTAKAYVINADNFFDDRETPPVAEILHGDAPENRYRRKRLWQYPHRLLCTTLSVICGENFAFFRTRTQGAWTFIGSEGLVRGGIAEAPLPSDDVLSRRIAIAREFVADLRVDRDCVFLTVVPWAASPRAEASAIAEALGVKLFAPLVADVHTFDGSHLDKPSAQAWSSEFFAVAGDEIRRCARSLADDGTSVVRPGDDAKSPATL